MRGIMSRIYKVGMLHERVTKNPVEHVETRCKSDYRAIVLTPAQTLAHSELTHQQCFILRWSLPVRLQRSDLRRFWRCAGRI